MLCEISGLVQVSLTWYQSPRALIVYPFQHRRRPVTVLIACESTVSAVIKGGPPIDHPLPREILPSWSTIIPGNYTHFFQISWSSEVGHSLCFVLLPFVHIVFITNVQFFGLSSFSQNSTWRCFRFLIQRSLCDLIFLLIIQWGPQSTSVPQIKDAWAIFFGSFGLVLIWLLSVTVFLHLIIQRDPEHSSVIYFKCPGLIYLHLFKICSVPVVGFQFCFGSGTGFHIYSVCDHCVLLKCLLIDL